MAVIQQIRSAQAAAALADLLNGNKRRKPIVVVTIAAGKTEPLIDVEEIAREAGPLAEVYLMPTGEATWEFARHMADGTQVFGSAGRVYPVGHDWTRNLSKAQIRFAFDERAGKSATELLVSDMLRAAASAGLLKTVSIPAGRQATGKVKFVVAGRAFVELENGGSASIAEELTSEDLQIDQIVAPDQQVAGWFDPQSRRLDVSKELTGAAEALSHYRPGDVVLAKVKLVRNGKTELVLYPKTSTEAVVVPVLRAEVTTNPLDDLRTLLSVGEVVAARIGTAGPNWSLVLSDVDDDEPIVPAPSLLAGGPPWLVADDFEKEYTEPAVEHEPLLPAPESLAELQIETPVVEDPTPVASTASATASLRPSPAMFDRKRKQAQSPHPAPVAPRNTEHRATEQAPAAEPPESTKSLLMKIDALNAEVKLANLAKEEFRLQAQAAADELNQVRYLQSQAERRANKAEHELKGMRSRLRKSGRIRPESASTPAPKFADPEQGFRHLVLSQWATRTPVSEQADRPLGDYVLGERFMQSVAELEGIKLSKIADVVFEIVTGIANSNPSREVHRLRTGSGGEDPVRVRPDGAIGWRASLQVNSPSARRIHYWMLPSGLIEFAQVATHDDFTA